MCNFILPGYGPLAKSLYFLVPGQSQKKTFFSKASECKDSITAFHYTESTLHSGNIFPKSRKLKPSWWTICAGLLSSVEWICPGLILWPLMEGLMKMPCDPLTPSPLLWVSSSLLICLEAFLVVLLAFKTFVISLPFQ